MSTVKIPEGHQAVMPYLIINNAAGFLSFAKTVFNAEETLKKMRDDGSTIMHAEINVSGSTIMFAESTDQWRSQTAGLFIYVEDADETFAKAIKAGADTVMELADQNYGRSGGIKDPSGNVWWITSVK